MIIVKEKNSAPVIFLFSWKKNLHQNIFWGFSPAAATEANGLKPEIGGGRHPSPI